MTSEPINQKSIFKYFWEFRVLNRAPFLFAVILLVSLVILLFGIIPLGRWTFNWFSEGASQYSQYRSLQNIFPRLDSLEKLQVSLHASLSDLERALPKESPASAALGLISAEAQACSLTVVTLHSLEPVRWNSNIEFPFEIDLNGSFSQVYQFCNHLESGTLIVRIRQLQVESFKIHRADIRVKLQLSLYMPEL